MRIWYASWVVYQQRVVLLAILSCPSSPLWGPNPPQPHSASLEAGAGWFQSLSQHSKQAPTFLNIAECYFYGSETGRRANECPYNKGRMARWSENFFIPMILTYVWKLMEDWIVYKQKNMWISMNCLQQNLLSQRQYCQSRGDKLASKFRFLQSLLWHTNM